jgi:hypothetical protein
MNSHLLTAHWPLLCFFAGYLVGIRPICAYSTDLYGLVYNFVTSRSTPTYFIFMGFF